MIKYQHNLLPCYEYLVLILVSLIVLLVPFELLAKSQFILHDEHLDGRFIGKFLEYAEDENASMQIEDVTRKNFSSNFQESSEDTLSFGYTSSAYWIRISVLNPSDENKTWYLEDTHFGINTIELYSRDNAKYTRHVAGNYHINDNDLDEIHHSFKLTTPPGKKTYYLKYVSNGGITISLRSLSKDILVIEKRNTTAIMATFYGILLVMVIYNLITFLSTRKLSYIFYVLHTICLMIQSLTLDGYGYLLYVPSNNIFMNLPIPFISLSALTGILFSRSYLKTAVHTPLIDKYLLLPLIIIQGIFSIIYLPVFNFISIQYKSYIPYTISIPVVFAMVTVIAAFILGVLYTSRKIREGYFYFAAYILLLAGSMSLFLRDAGILPYSFFTTYGYHIGIVSLLLVFSIGMGDQINNMRKELLRFNEKLKLREKEAIDHAENLQKVIHTISSTSTELVTISNELSEIGKKLLDISQEQAAGSEELSSSFEQLTSSTTYISENTSKQNREVEETQKLIKLLQLAMEEVSDGNLKVIDSISSISKTANNTEASLKEMLNKMEVIHEGGALIENFISMIYDISDKINLLSLNAAIEAARAGDTGRGFAVVADEIGKLANATSTNSRQITNEISRISKDIKDGMDIVTNTKESTESVFQKIEIINNQTDTVIKLITNQGNALKEVITQEEIIQGLSSEIANATFEQTTAMAETMTMINRLSEMSQELNDFNIKLFGFTETINKKVIVLDEIIFQGR
ncbi:MAG: methyl-accepting chemotaxis protein [Spirochaetota bacterium]